MANIYSEEQISKIQQELMSNTDKENDFLKEIERLSASIASRLVKEKHTHEEFMGTDFIFNLNYDRA